MLSILFFCLFLCLFVFFYHLLGVSVKKETLSVQNSSPSKRRLYYIGQNILHLISVTTPLLKSRTVAGILYQVKNLPIKKYNVIDKVFNCKGTQTKNKTNHVYEAGYR